MKPKKIVQLLKREAKKLPEQTYFALEKYYKPRFDDKSGEWKVGEVVEHKINHGRRVKKIYKKWGMQAVNAYFYVKGQLIQQKQSKNEENSNEQLIATDIANELFPEIKREETYSAEPETGDSSHSS